MFQNKLKVEVPLDGKMRVLLAPLHYLNEQYDFLIPMGFKTNYGSVPMIFQSLISASGQATYGYVLHDYHYYTGILSRIESDKILRQTMSELGVSKWRVHAVYYGLRIGGRKRWDELRAKEKNDAVKQSDNQSK